MRPRCLFAPSLQQPSHPRRRRASVLAICSVVALAAPLPSAAADPVIHWNLRSETYLNGPPPIQGRTRAMIQIAVHDALNAIDSRYVSYTSVSPAYAGGAPEAAVAAATHRVLVDNPGPGALNATQKSDLGAEVDAYVLAIACSPLPTCRTRGIDAGEAAARAILALREHDNARLPEPTYPDVSGAGVYRPTPNVAAVGSCNPGPTPAPMFQLWSHVTPFVITSASQFRMDPPEMFDLTSEAYARDYDEVRRLGRCDSTARTPDQSDLARYYPGGAANFNGVARDILADAAQATLASELDSWELAHLFALLNIANADANVAVFDTKYHYRFWRPVTAIRDGDLDGNAATEKDGAWLSYLPTPPYPDFTCGLTTATGASVEVLRRWFGTDDLHWTRTAAGVTRTYRRLSDAERDAVDARVFGGMHFRTGCVHGVRQGEKVGRYVVLHALKPLRQHGRSHLAPRGWLP